MVDEVQQERALLSLPYSALHASVQASASRHWRLVVSKSSLLVAFSSWSFVFLTQDESNLDAFFCRTLCDMFDILGCYLIQLYIKHIPTVSCPVSGGFNIVEGNMKEYSHSQAGLEDFLQTPNLIWYKIHTWRAPLSGETFKLCRALCDSEQQLCQELTFTEMVIVFSVAQCSNLFILVCSL